MNKQEKEVLKMFQTEDNRKIEEDKDDYSPPVSTKDTHNTARKIEKDGISIIGVALEEERGNTECY